jgi:MFS family permease
VRRSIPETPPFEEARLRVGLAALVSVVSTVTGVFALSYAVNGMGLPRTTMLAVLVLSSLVALVVIPAWAWLADKVGRKRVFIAGALGSAWLIWPFLWAWTARETHRVPTHRLGR